MLNEECDCPLTSHHLISFSEFETLTSERIKQIDSMGYNWNCLDNLVILPSSDTIIARKVGCKYRLPWHSSGHTGNKTIQNVQIENEDVLYSNVTVESMQNGGDPQKRTSMLNSDKNKIKAYPTKAYHKFVRQELIETLEKLHCDMKPPAYRKELNDLSQKICDMISEFTILLHNTGDDFSPSGSGCRSAGCEGRNHNNQGWPDISNIWDRMFYKTSGVCNYLKVAGKL
ncbi:hypothetical protein AT251_22375 [Enterovibrio nigricans]|nr:AHH domain-containing protein [Enterovibrio nigricans]PKF48959.1 hypothetical protein AT251_22375 [Enterovibrio nigricans]